jgi:hypothetical protein
MPITTGGFEDLVQLSQDTLYYVGADFEIGNTSVGSSASIGFNNTAGDLQLVGVATGNATVFLPNAGGTLLSNINVSAGTTSNNLSAVTLSNSNNVSFGLNGSTVTATATVASTQGSINLSAGTTSNLASAFVFSNSNNVSFGLNGSTVTATATVASTQGSINLSAGTTSNLASAFTFSNKNGVSFGLNASTVTAVYGGFSNWQNGAPITSFNSSNGFMSLQPIVVPYAMTVTRLIFLASLSVGTSSSGSSGAISLNVGLYTLAGGTSGTMNLASSASSQLSWTSGGPFSSSSAIGYQQMTVSWVLTPGPYLFGMAIASSNVTQTVNLYGTASIASVASGFGTAISSMPWLPGFSVSSVTICPASIGVTNTASWVRSGSSVFMQPWISFQGT